MGSRLPATSLSCAWAPLLTIVRFTSSWAGGSLVLQDLREICDKRDVWQKSFQQAADERDQLQGEVAQLKRRLSEQDSSGSKKEATTLRKVCVCAPAV